MEKKERLKQLEQPYMFAYGVVDSLFNSELIDLKAVEQQISVTLDIAKTLRDSIKDGSVNISDYFADIDDEVSDLYFSELKLRGDEWVNADLREAFLRK